jgi:hypothetical protein
VATACAKPPAGRAGSGALCGGDQNACDLNTKLVEMVRANAEAALEASTQIANAKNPADLAQAWSTHATKQFAMLTDQARELTAVWQSFSFHPAETYRPK